MLKKRDSLVPAFLLLSPVLLVYQHPHLHLYLLQVQAAALATPQCQAPATVEAMLALLGSVLVTLVTLAAVINHQVIQVVATMGVGVILVLCFGHQAGMVRKGVVIMIMTMTGKP